LDGLRRRGPASRAAAERAALTGRVAPRGRAVLLDGLGTLVALDPPGQALVERLRETHGVRLGLAEAERAFRAEIAYYRAHHHEAGDAAALEDLRLRCARVLRAELPAAVGTAVGLADLKTAMLGSLRFSAYPDAPAALAALRARGATLVVVSNWDVSLPAVLRAVGLEGLLDGVVTSAEVGVPKPAPAIFAAALALAGVGPRDAVHVGDSLEHDVRGAQAAGIAPVLLRRSDAESAQAPADAEPAQTPAGVRAISTLAELAPTGGP
jgi:putative hydrolase of the HAD superfamily